MLEEERDACEGASSRCTSYPTSEAALEMSGRDAGLIQELSPAPRPSFPQQRCDLLLLRQQHPINHIHDPIPCRHAAEHLCPADQEIAPLLPALVESVADLLPNIRVPFQWPPGEKAAPHR